MLARGGGSPKRKAPDWTDAEKDVVRQIYPTGGWAAVKQALPRRTKTSILKKACELRVAPKRHYSRSENLTLERLWEAGLELDRIAERMGRTPGSVYDHALAIGLRVAVPRGFECLTLAAERSGFARESLRAVLRWAGVKIHRNLSDPAARKKMPKWHRHYVDPLAVDDAIARWMKTETLLAAAKARGLHDFVLKRWLVEAGIIEPRPPGSRRLRWRIPTETIDRVIMERRQRMARAELLGSSDREAA
jgi:hypothetical protein